MKSWPFFFLQGKSKTRPIQNWWPVHRLQDGCLIRPDGAVVAGLKIAPFNLSLKSERETQGIIKQFQAALAELTIPWQLLSLYRPVDLDTYLNTLDHQTQEVHGRRRQVLREYGQWVQSQGAGGQVERRYYLLMTRQGPDAVAAHRQTLRSVMASWTGIRGFRATVLDDALWRELVFWADHVDEAVHLAPLAPRPAPGLSMSRQKEVSRA